MQWANLIYSITNKLLSNGFVKSSSAGQEDETWGGVKDGYQASVVCS